MSLSQSRVAALGQLFRMGDLFDPVVQKLFEILRDEPVVHADETGLRNILRTARSETFCGSYVRQNVGELARVPALWR